MRVSVLIASSIATLISVSLPAHAGLAFNLIDTGGVGVGTVARQGFSDAAGLWSSAFTNDVTINLRVGFQKLGSGILGQTGSSSGEVSYGQVRRALGQRIATLGSSASATDISAYASLAPTLRFESNTRGGVTKSSIHVYDSGANRGNGYLAVNTAEQKALGIIAPNREAIDASITFSNGFRWTFDATSGIARGTYDFVGIAAHEIGHALGFVSGVDTADYYAKYGYYGLDSTAWVTPLDLFRYQNGVRDLTLGGKPCLSIDGGATCGPAFATGYFYGDHRQASHWKDNLGLGILDPTAAAGETLKIGNNDLTAFDLLGWDLASNPGGGSTVHWATAGSGARKPTGTHAVPEPAALGLMGVAAASLALARRRTGRCPECKA